MLLLIGVRGSFCVCGFVGSVEYFVIFCIVVSLFVDFIFFA